MHYYELSLITAFDWKVGDITQEGYGIVAVVKKKTLNYNVATGIIDTHISRGKRKNRGKMWELKL